MVNTVAVVLYVATLVIDEQMMLAFSTLGNITRRDGAAKDTIIITLAKKPMV